MLLSEAALLCQVLDSLAPESILDIGSGNRAGREIVQPHIGAAFRGHNVVWTDMEGSPGTLKCDITDKGTLASLPRCEMVTCLSVLEHVTDIDAALENVRVLVERWLIVAVPHTYPKHDCPIDNMWRPTPEQLTERVEGLGLRVMESWLTGPERFGDVYPASASVVLAEVI